MGIGFFNGNLALALAGQFFLVHCSMWRGDDPTVPRWFDE